MIYLSYKNFKCEIDAYIKLPKAKCACELLLLSSILRFKVILPSQT